MRKSLFKNLSLNATFTYKGDTFRKITPTLAISPNNPQTMFDPNTPVNYHKSKPLDISHSNTEQS